MLAAAAAAQSGGLPLRLQSPTGPPAGQPSTRSSPPPAALAEPFRDYCRERGAGCPGGYVPNSGDFLQDRALGDYDRQVDRQRQAAPPPPAPAE